MNETGVIGRSGNNENGGSQEVGQRVTAGSAHVWTGGKPAALNMRLARFNAAADMPADITNSADVSANKITFNGFSASARKVQLIWHGPSGFGGAANSHSGVAIGAIVTINAGDDTTADLILTYTDLTGGGVSSSGKSDVLFLSAANPVVDLALDTQLLRVDAIGVPVQGVGTPVFESCFLELRVVG